MALGRSAPMLTSASPDRAAAMVPAPVERSELPGHRQRSQIPQHRQWCSVNRLRCRHARARRRRFQRALTPTDPAPAGWAALRLLADVDISFSRNCCWQIWRWTLELGRPAPMLTSASPDRAAAMVPAPIERSELPGHRQQIGKSAALSVRRSPSLAQRCGAAARKDQRNLAAFAAVTRARIIGETRRLLTNRPGSSFFTKRPIPTNVYASAIGLCKDLSDCEDKVLGLPDS